MTTKQQATGQAVHYDPQTIRLRSVVVDLSQQKIRALRRLTDLSAKENGQGFIPGPNDYTEQGDINGQMFALDLAIDSICEAMGTNVWDVLAEAGLNTSQLQQANALQGQQPSSAQQERVNQ